MTLGARLRGRGGTIVRACLAVAALAGCGRVSFTSTDAEPLDGSRLGFDAGADASADAGTDAGNDAGRDAGGVCVPSTEICNRVDDDCDGFIDESLLSMVTAAVTPDMPPTGFIDNSYYRIGWDPTSSRHGVAYGWFASSPMMAGARFVVADRTGGLVGTPTVTGPTIGSGIYLMDLAFTGSEWVVPIATLSGSVTVRTFSSGGAPGATIPLAPTGASLVATAATVVGSTPFAIVVEQITPGLQVLVVNLTTRTISGPTLVSDPICNFLVDASVTATATGFGLAYGCQPGLLADDPYVAYSAVDTSAAVSPPIRFASDNQQERNIHACYDAVTDRVVVVYDVQLMRGGGGPVSAWFAVASPDASAVQPPFPLTGQTWVFGEGCAGDGALGVLGNAAGSGAATFRRWRLTDGAQVPGEFSAPSFYHMQGVSTGARYFTLAGTITSSDVHLGGIECM